MDKDDYNSNAVITYVNIQSVRGSEYASSFAGTKAWTRKKY